MSYLKGFFLPLGKGLTPVETEKTDCEACLDCFFEQDCNVEGGLNCTANHREDGKNVIFKLIDLP